MKKIFFLLLMSVLILPNFALAGPLTIKPAGNNNIGSQALWPNIISTKIKQRLIPTEPFVKPTPGLVTISFDDGLISTLDLAAPAMAEHGFVGTAYIYTQAQDEEYDEGFMQWVDVLTLKDTYGWEIGSHAYSHDNLTAMPLSEAKKELNQSKQDLLAHGIEAKSFASPYGAYNTDIVEYATNLFESHRTAWNLPNTHPVNNYYLKARPVLPETDPAEVKSWIDSAKANDEWLILYFHALTEGTALPENDDYNLDNFKSILTYLDQVNISVVTTTQGVNAWGSGDNLIVNGDFLNGTENWKLSDPNYVKINSNGHGNYPDPIYSASIEGSENTNSISTLELPVIAGRDYRLKGFFRVADYLGGDSSVWISEFNENYSYLGGQWLGGFNYNFLGTKYFDYIPSAGTKNIELFFLTHSGAEMTLEVDNVELKSKN